MDSDLQVKMDPTSSQESNILTPSALEHLMTELNGDYGFNVVENAALNSCDSTSFNRFRDTNETGEMVVTTTNIISLNEEPVNHNSVIHDPTGKSPSTEDYGGPYNFRIQLSPSNRNRSSWAFSEILNKVFIDVDRVMQVQFVLSPLADEVYPLAGLSVRALLLYTSPDHFSTPVKRCFLHKGMYDKKQEAHANPGECRCKDFNLVGHVLTTTNDNAYYEYNSISERHSLVVPINPAQPEYDDTTVGYKFGCKTSCLGGMARRAARIVFTLETPTGDVVGRRSLFFKVCCCPKRDKERDESEVCKDASNTDGCKKRKITTVIQERENNENVCNKKIKINPEEIVVPQNHLQEFNQQLLQEPQEPFNIQQIQQEQHRTYDLNSEFEGLHQRMSRMEQGLADIGQKVDTLINLLMFQR